MCHPICSAMYRSEYSNSSEHLLHSFDPRYQCVNFLWGCKAGKADAQRAVDARIRQAERREHRAFVPFAHAEPLDTYTPISERRLSTGSERRPGIDRLTI